MTPLLLVTLTTADLAGSYSMRVREIGSELILKPNGTFDYMFAYGAADYWAKGTWRPGPDGVILHTGEGKREKPFELGNSAKIGAPTVQIRITPPVPNIDVTLITHSGRTKARTNSKGVATFEKEGAVKGVEFAIPVFAFQSGVIDLNPAHDDFSFRLNGPSINEVRFHNEPLKLQGNTLHMRNWSGGGPAMLYVKND